MSQKKVLAHNRDLFSFAPHFQESSGIVEGFGEVVAGLEPVVDIGLFGGEELAQIALGEVVNATGKTTSIVITFTK